MRPADYGAEGGKELIQSFPGSVVTRRWFEVNKLAHLESPFRMRVYRPTRGREPWVAMCQQVFGDILRTRKFNYGDPYHQVADKDCSCGFYSYFDEPSPFDLEVYDSTDRHFVGAVIENYGRVTYASAGLRAEKMRLLALVIPKKIRPSIQGFRNYWKLNGVRSPEMFFFLAMIAIIGGWLGGVYSIFFDPEDDMWLLWGYLIGFLLGPFVAFLVYVSWFVRHRDQNFLMIPELLKLALLAHYPNTPVYSSWEEAAKDFPHHTRKDLP